METGLIMLALLLLAIGLNFAFRRVVKAIEGPPVDSGDEGSPYLPRPATIGVNAILAEWGSNCVSSSTEMAGPVHAGTCDIMRRYPLVVPDAFPEYRVLDIGLAVTPFVGNDAFVQIGDWGDGFIMLLRRDESDPCVYYVDSNEDSQMTPLVIAQSVDDYLRVAWQNQVEYVGWCNMNGLDPYSAAKRRGVRVQ